MSTRRITGGNIREQLTKVLKRIMLNAFRSHSSPWLTMRASESVTARALSRNPRDVVREAEVVEQTADHDDDGRSMLFHPKLATEKESVTF
jgi:hypothetical protein